MAYNPNAPALTNRVQDDIAAMRGNFQHLAPLAQLAPAAGELQAVSELAPYVQALLNSRIVEHSLDVSSPPNGHYVRFENGWQICFGRLDSSPVSQHWNYLTNGADTTGIERQWTPPAAFSAASATYQDVMLD